MNRRLVTALAAVAAALAGWAIAPAPAFAHGFGVRYDLPVPLWMYVTGAGAAVALSFVVIGSFLRAGPGAGAYPRLPLLPGLLSSMGLLQRGAVAAVQAFAAALFLLVVAAGFFGGQEPTDNLAPTLIWVVWWVGMAYVCALAGNLWALVNPWKTLYRWAESAVRALSGGELSLNRPYPPSWGLWPGLALFGAFAWVELVYVNSAVPAHLARLTVVYSLITWAGMTVYGRETWLRHGEAFSLVFGFLARFAPLEVQVTDRETCQRCPADCLDDDGCVGCGHCLAEAPAGGRRVNLRPFAAGLLRDSTATVSATAFVVALLSTVTFDGLTATPLYANVYDALLGVVGNGTAVNTLALVAFVAGFGGAYMGFAGLMSWAVGGRISAGGMARTFVYSLIPIALAYHLAHFLSFMLIQGQLIIPLSSDPFGFGWDLFGTADYRVNAAIINARTTWLLAVAAIVIGHVIAVYLAHTMALRALRGRGLALRSQLPMLALMVGYTMFSLWLLAQPITESG